MEKIAIDDYKKQWVFVYSTAFRLTANQHEAEDLAQDTLVTALEKSDQLEDMKALKSWLRQICINKFLMKKRKEKDYTELSYDQLTELEHESYTYQFKSNDPLPEDEVIVDESIKEMRNGCFLAMTRKLTLNQRIAFSLTDMFGMEIEDVARIIGISKPAAKSLLHRGRMNIDNFFAAKCNLIYVNNPCSCKTDIELSQMKNDLKSETKKRIKNFKFGDKPDSYSFNSDVRNRVENIYKTMPDKIPTKEWYNSVIKEISKINH